MIVEGHPIVSSGARVTTDASYTSTVTMDKVCQTQCNDYDDQASQCNPNDTQGRYSGVPM